jgi:release factor glutamine methyltransferase
MQAREALRQATDALAKVSDTPRLDAELLMAHALDVGRNDLLLRHLDGIVPSSFDAYVQRRLGHEPIAYIIGKRDFWTISLSVGPGVLVPRADSETLIEAAVELFADRKPKSILDLGTGPGTLLLAALSEFPEAGGLGIDSSEVALGYARQNAVELGLSERVTFKSGNWAEGVEGPFDLILCNPPYIESDASLDPQVVDHEPHQALFAGPDGLDDYRLLAPQIARLLARDGVALIEIGHQQAESVSAMFSAQGLKVQVRRDLAGRDRCLIVRY